MQERDVPVAIIGGGLSGLYAAFLLEQKGIDYVLLEARDRLGGRILAAKYPADIASNNITSNNLDTDNVDTDNQKVEMRFDLGPSWFWPDYQPQLSQLIDTLNLTRFNQFEDGEMMVEHTASQPPIRTQGYKSAPPSMRLIGGMTSLVEALYARLNPTRVMTRQVVERLTKTDQFIEIHSKPNVEQGTASQRIIYRAQHVLLALPPRLAANIMFEPVLPPDLINEWQGTATWMAPHAKYIAVYDTAFWREHGLSGSARSAVGPLTEIHDASSSDISSATGNGALFGFFGVSAHVRQSVSESELKAHCRAQLLRLFGVQADTPSAEYIKDWAQDSWTALPADIDDSVNGQHAVAPTAKPNTGVWQNCLTGSASEWSSAFPGYIAGAIDAADKAMQGLPESVLATSALVSSPHRTLDE